jgi:hypothetical protein
VFFGVFYPWVLSFMGFVHDFKNGVDLGAFLENAERKYVEYKRKGDGRNDSLF